MSMIETTQSPFRSYQQPRRAFVPISRVRYMAALPAPQLSIIQPAPLVPLIPLRLPAGCRRMDGKSHRLDLARMIYSRPLRIPSEAEMTMQMAIRGIEPALTERPPIRKIQEAVSVFLDCPMVDLLSDRRTKELIRPRHVAMYLAKKLTLHSLPEIGRRFGGKDHTTVMHAARKIEAARKTDAALDEAINTITASLRSPRNPEGVAP